MRLALIGAIAAVIIGLATGLYFAVGRIGDLRVENDRLEGRVASLQTAVEVAEHAATVAAARAASNAAKAKEYDKLREGVYRDATDDTQLPFWLRDVVDGLRAGSPDGDSDPEGSE